MTMPGAKVLIASDCRGDGLHGKANGFVGVYEGEFPRRCVIAFRASATDKFRVSALFSYEAAQKLKFFDVMKHENPWESSTGLSEIVGEPFIVIECNPRIRLPDGSVIWGDECWWCEVPGGDNANN